MSDSVEKQQLFEAAKNNDVKLVQSFLNRKDETSVAAVKAKKTLQTCLAQVAVKNGHVDVLRVILEKEPSILLEVDENDDILLDLAVRANAIDTVSFLVGQHESNGYDWASAVHTAIQCGHMKILKYFMEDKMANVDSPERWQYQPPIFVAVRFNRTDMFEYLVEEKKANVTALDYNKENILFEAVRQNALALMKNLLDEKNIDIDVNYKNWAGEGLVHLAATLNRVKILRYLVGEWQADVDVQRKSDRQTPLHCAADENHFEACKYLLEEAKASAQIKDEFGRTPAQEATDKRLIEYFENFAAKRGRRSVRVTDSDRSRIYRREDTRHSTLRLTALPFESNRIPEGAFARIAPCPGGRKCQSIAEVAHFQSFLMLAKLGMRNVMTKRWPEIDNLAIISSPLSVLQDRVSSAEIDFVDRNSNFHDC